MKGLILDYNTTEAFVLLEDDTVTTIPIASLPSIKPIGSNISLNNLYNKNNHNSNCYNTIDFM